MELIICRSKRWFAVQRLLTTSKHLPLLRELTGLSPVKPFDCVATRSEMCVALAALPAHLRALPLFESLTQTEWQYITNEAEKGTHYLTDVYPHFLPEAVSKKLFAVV